MIYLDAIDPLIAQIDRLALVGDVFVQHIVD